MTDARPRRRRPGAFAVWSATGALFLAVLVLLTWQMAAGRDPKLGLAKANVPAQPAPVIRRIVHRKVVITTILPAREPAVAAAAAPAAVRTSAPAATVVRSAPAAAVPVAPAPAPAPVATRTS